MSLDAPSSQLQSGHLSQFCNGNYIQYVLIDK